MFENFKTFHYTFAGRPLVIETGKMAQLANASCLVRYGDTAVLCCATASAKPREGIDFLPLSVDFEERMYAAGKIPGGYFRREGKPTEKAILTARVIDRPIRPLFPKDLRNDVALTLTVMSVDQDCSPEISAMIGASVALSISDIPWNGPIGGVFMGLVDGKLVVNDQCIDPMPVITGAAEYPQNISEAIKAAGAAMIELDALSLAVKAGSAKAVNVVLIGAMASHMQLSYETWINAIKNTVPEKFLDMNLEAFRLGYEHEKTC